jgi:hypothetical protein
MGATQRRAIFATATLAVVVACRQLVGIGDDPPMGPGTTVDSGAAEAGPDGPDEAGIGVTYTGVACQACLESNCRAQAAACAESQPCSAFEQCVGLCAGAPACRAKCVQTVRVGTDDATPVFESCVARSCEAPCGLVCAGVAEVATPDGALLCQDCYQSQGCSATVTCLSNPACAAFAFCLAEALTPNESFNCSELLEDGGVDASAFESLAENNCASSCEFTSNWSCVDHVIWPPGTSGDLTILLTLFDVLNGPAPPGITAKVCGDSDFPCDHPSATAVTGPDGTVSLTQHVDAGPVFTNGYVDLSGGDDGGILPEAFFWSFPLSTSPATFAVAVGTPADVAKAALLLGVTQDPSNGIVFVSGFDCLQLHGSGLTYAIPGAPQPFYESGGIPLAGLTSTDGTGAGAFVNVPAGVLLPLTASLANDGGAIGTFPLFVREGGFTQVLVLPQPQ